MSAFPQDLSHLLSAFPPVTFAFAYGSAVFPQHHKKDLMVPRQTDVILAVEDSESWHRQNLERNRNHYSFVGSMGSRVVSWVQEDFGARIYFNPFTMINNMEVKYGVTKHSHLLADLTKWDSLYTSGRMQKPVLTLKSNTEVAEASEANLSHALHCSLAVLPQKFTQDELFTTICSLSYLGDMRMSMFGLGEDPNKVKNIVNNNRDRFQALYRHTIQSCGVLQANCDLTSFEQDMSSSGRRLLVDGIPDAVKPRQQNLNTIELGKQVQHNISRLVNKSSWAQACKGIVSAGVMKSVVYTAHKISKAIRARV